MLRTILVVEDNEVNRSVLCDVLSGDYHVLEAQNGKEALAVLQREKDGVSAVLLDLVMPVMDGFETLAAIRADRALASIPVLVASGHTDTDAEVKALASGANDFVTKPYNAEIIKRRLWNTINLRETAAVVNAIQRDKLTGLFNRETFFARAEELIAAREPGYYIMACFDIDNFKIINDQYGSAKGDDILRQMADVLRAGFAAADGVCGRITADNFAVLYPRSFMETKEIADIRHRLATLDGSIYPISFSIGRYLVTDLSLSGSAMYDRAAIAEASVKARFDVKIAQYDESMRQSILREQEIINEMKSALASGQFETWLQPQYNHSSGALVGAEALVRWRHPRLGLIPPGVFVPVFERNGFIYEMDKYIWEQVCMLLRQWLDEGRQPIPISVNVSRYDIFREDFYAVLTGLVESYGIPKDLLRLEITESAFAKSTGQIISEVKRLIQFGFTVEIDDFGSGYSSLNTLKDVPANALKLDMRFLENSSHSSSRGGTIVEAVIRMAKWLGMPVIAEGVETLAQADYLCSIGCFYVQGYLYAKPMPVSSFCRLTDKSATERAMMRLETVESLDNNMFWDPKSMETLIFNSYVGGACVFEYHNGETEILRANEKYARTLGEGMSVEDALKIKITDYLDEPNRRLLFQNIQTAVQTDAESTCEIRLSDLPGTPGSTYIRSSVRVIARTGDRMLLYCSIINMTAQRKAEHKEREAAGQLQAIMRNIRGGVSAVTIDRQHGVRFLFSNDQYYSMLGYTREQFAKEIRDPFTLVHPDDRECVMELTREGSVTMRPFTCLYRALRRDGETIWIQSNIAIVSLSGIDAPVQIAVANDITAQVEAEHKEREASARLQAIMDNVGGGVSALTFALSGKPSIVFANDQYYSMLGYTKEQFEAEAADAFSVIHPGDRGRIRAALTAMLQTGGSAAYEYRCQKRDGSVIHLRCNVSVTDWKDVRNRVLIAVTTDISDLVSAEQKTAQTTAQMEGIMRNVHGGVSAATLSGAKVSYLFVNDWYFAMFGYTREQFESELPRGIVDLIHPDDLPMVLDAATHAEKTGEPFQIEYRTNRRDGSMIWVRSYGSVYYMDGSKTPVQLAVTSNITKEKEYERELLLSHLNKTEAIAAREELNRERVYQKALDTYTPVFTVIYAVETGAILHIGGTLLSAFGYTREDFETFHKRYLKGFVLDEDYGTAFKPVRPFRGSISRFVEQEFRVRKKDGSVAWLYQRGALAKLDGENAYILVFMDITGRKEMEERLRVSEEELRLAMERLGKMVCVYDAKTQTLTMPDVYVRKHGFSSPSLRLPADAGGIEQLDQSSRAALAAFYQSVLDGEKTGSTEIHIQSANGAWHWERGEFVTVFSGDGAPIRAIVTVEDVTSQHEKDDESESIRESERILRVVAAHSNRVIYRYDIAAQTCHTDPAIAEQGGEAGAAPGASGFVFQNGLVLPESEEAYRTLFRDIHSGKPEGSAKLHMEGADGRLYWVDMRFTVIDRNADGTPKMAALSYEDVTDNHEKEIAYERYRQSIIGDKTKKCSSYFESDLTANLVEKQGGRLSPECCPAFCGDHDTAVRAGVESLLAAQQHAQAIEFFSRKRLLRCFDNGTRSLAQDFQAVSQGDDARWIRAEVQLIQDPYSGHIRASFIMRDITEEKLAAISLQKRIETDGMTGLYNKATTEELIRRRLSRNDGNPCALLIVDLDNLKTINDVQGHDYGDRAIRSIGDALRSQFRQTDVVGRFGGDEFVVFLDNCGTEAWLSGLLVTLMKRLYAIRIGDQGQLPLRGSIGIAMGVTGRDAFDELFRHADQALYHVKRNGKNDFAFYTPEMEKAAYQFKAHEETELWRENLLSRTETDHLLSAMNAVYPLVISVNLTKNRYYLLQYENFHTRSNVQSGVFDELIAWGAASFHPEDRQSFLDAFSRSALLSAHERGKTLVGHTGRQLGDDGVYRSVRTDVVFVNNPDGSDVLEITLSREISPK